MGNSKGYVSVVDESWWMARESSKPIEEIVEGDSVYQLGGWSGCEAVENNSVNTRQYNIQIEESATYRGHRIGLQLFCNMLRRSAK
jgi:hypothetical protein